MRRKSMILCRNKCFNNLKTAWFLRALSPGHPLGLCLGSIRGGGGGLTGPHDLPAALAGLHVVKDIWPFLFPAYQFSKCGKYEHFYNSIPIQAEYRQEFEHFVNG